MASLFTDDFNRTNANPIGGNWTTLTGMGDWELNSNKARATANSDSAAYVNSITPANDQWAKLILDTVPTAGFSGDGIGPACRMSTSAKTLYECTVANSAGLSIAKRVAGTYTQMASNFTGFVATDEVYIEAQGASPNIVVKVKKNGTVVLTAPNDSSIASGRFGVIFSADGSTTNTFIDNFEGGDFSAGGSVGASAATSTATAVGTAKATVNPSSAGTSTATAVGTAKATATGTAASTSTCAAVGQASASAPGTAAATSTALAVGQATGVTAGSAASTSTVSGVGQATATATGSAAGTSTALGIAPSGNIGTANSTSTATAIGQASAQANGAATGTSTADGVGVARGTITGSASGTSTALAVSGSSAVSIGFCASTSTALAIGLATAEAIGTAAGTSTALGAGPIAAFGMKRMRSRRGMNPTQRGMKPL